MPIRLFAVDRQHQCANICISRPFSSDARVGTFADQLSPLGRLANLAPLFKASDTEYMRAAFGLVRRWNWMARSRGMDCSWAAAAALMHYLRFCPTYESFRCLRRAPKVMLSCPIPIPMPCCPGRQVPAYLTRAGGVTLCHVAFPSRVRNHFFAEPEIQQQLQHSKYFYCIPRTTVYLHR